MENSVREELLNHILDRINDGVIDDTDKDEWHFKCFNEDYYIVYHSVARNWLKKHDIDVFEAIETVFDYERDNFGEINTEINPEAIVNMLAYIWGEELLYSFDVETIEELREEIETELE